MLPRARKTVSSKREEGELGGAQGPKEGSGQDSPWTEEAHHGDEADLHHRLAVPFREAPARGQGRQVGSGNLGGLHDVVQRGELRSSDV